MGHHRQVNTNNTLSQKFALQFSLQKMCKLEKSKLEPVTELEQHTMIVLGDVDIYLLVLHNRRAVAQAVSRWLPTAARVRVRAACDVCGRQSGTGTGFLRVFRFPLPIIPPVSPSS
jgi:prophage antirepressor-like protein